ELPAGDTLVAVLYSSLNYKDGLAVTGRGKIIRGDYPFVPGIDLVGRIEETESARFNPGDLVIGTGWGLGEAHWGGYAQVQRVESSWLVPLPADLSPQDAMTMGTAGLTAMLAVMALKDHGVTPGSGEVVVSGASGGVGSISVALLAHEGFNVVASTGSAEAGEYLLRLGAHRVIDRGLLGEGPKRPLDSAQWAGAVDSVGGATLAAILSRLQTHGSVAACGLAGGHELHTTVFPFILRGVNLLGIDSNTCPNDLRERAWSYLSHALTEDMLGEIRSAIIGLEEIPEFSERLLAGDLRGRVVVDVNRYPSS
ncbi:MAG: MDR family oxidoreductase, partial [Rhodothermales bacterium]